jgi:uncharacterized protein YkwD
MSQNQGERRRSGWLLLLVPLIATLAAGAFFGRSYFDGTGIAELIGASATPAATTPANPARLAGAAPGVSTPAAPAAETKGVDLGTVRGRYLLKGPAKAPAGSVVVFVLAGPNRAVHTDSDAPYTFPFDSQRIPNGTYTVGVTVIRPGLPTLSQTQLMQVANTASKVAKKSPSVAPTPGTGAAASKGAGSAGSGTPSTKGLSAQAAQVLALTNQQRAAVGCKPLTASSKLTTAAQAHSADMAKNNYFTHDSQDGTSPFDRIKALGYNFRAAAENIAYGQGTAASVMDAWMNSPGHKANILNCTYTQIGIGYALRSGTPYWTQDFATPL